MTRAPTPPAAVNALTQSAQSATSWAEIDLSAIRHNAQVIAQHAAPAAVAAVIKADGYGHGAVAVGRAALEAGAAQLCVFTLSEAAQLRAAGIDAPILALGPVLDADPPIAAQLDIAVVVDAADTAHRLAAAARAAGARIRVQINLDSGMQRFGRPPAEAAALVRTIRALPELELEAAFTHFPDAANPDRQATHDAWRSFMQLTDLLALPRRHAAASAAAFSLPQRGLDLVRAGIALYGVDPAPEIPDTGAAALRPALAWRASLLSVRELSAGQSVSYGGFWTAARESRIGVIGVGYADGLRRALSPGGAVLVRSQPALFRGAICMDSAMIDLTAIPDAQVGDAVTIIGADGGAAISAWDLARQLDTIPYEIFTSIAPRVPRVVLDALA